MEELINLFVKLKRKLRLLNSDDAEEAYNCLNAFLHEDALLQKALDLSKKQATDIEVNQLCALLKEPHYRLEKLTLYRSGTITERDCADLVSALIVNPSHLRELDLNKNTLDKSGVHELCNLLMNPLCKLEKLKLVKTITEEFSFSLSSALCQNPSYIRELDLSENKLGDAGIKELCVLLENQDCKIQKLLLKKCSIEKEGCAALTSAFTLNPSHLRELDLRENRKLGDSAKKLAEMLQKSECKLLVDTSKMERVTSFLNPNKWTWVKSEKESGKAESAEDQDEMDQGDQRSDQNAEDQDEMDQGDQRSDRSAEGLDGKSQEKENKKKKKKKKKKRK
ncbi:ribonuclease inhibitor-like [Colossoma macropomum]|uniref:ribonuclease inhibitor-like n=1 Tax=Colossoma macropomum TaxID=42526 RepID=UPI001863FDC9|nr:ribonuclease inhibitor-like [Colossoma macropomum]